MAGPLPLADAWARALDRYTEDLSDSERELYSNATIESIFYEASAAEKTHRAGSSGRKFATDKLATFVCAIEAYGKAIDVYANASSMVLCPLWGSVRVVLHIAREVGDYYDKIVEMFSRIGDILPRLRDYEKLFGNYERLTQAITALYVDILEFCADAKSIFRTIRRPSMITLLVFAKSTWKPFKDRFEQKMAVFREHRKGVEKEAHLSHMLEAKRAQEIDQAARLKAELQERAGSGKSILASVVVNNLLSDVRTKQHAVVYYYCDYADHNTLAPRSIFGSLIQQILHKHQLPDELAKEIKNLFEYDEYMPTLAELKSLMHGSLSLSPSVSVILDGLDECDKAARHDVLSILNWLLNLDEFVIKVYVSTQSDIQILNSLEKHPRILVSPARLSSDIGSYVAHNTRSLIQEGQLRIQNRDLEYEIIAELTNRANGMFLWVVFQLQDLCEATSDYIIRQTLEDLPDGLYQTYDRKLAKLERGQKSLLVQKIFRWITAAKRPLLLDEVQEAIAFDYDDTSWNIEKLPHPDVILGSCESLVILDEDGKISFAHHTVQTFLLSHAPRSLHQDFHFDIVDANVLAAQVCVNYLSFTDFEAQVATRPRTMVHAQSTAGISTGGLRYLTRTLGISDSWFGLPYRLLGGNKFQSHKPIDVKWENKSPKSPIAPTMAEKYRFLDYAVANWLVHARYLLDACNNYEAAKGIDNTIMKKFRKLALERVMLFDHTRWDMLSSSEDLPFKAMYDWAMDNGHIPLLWLLESPPQGPSVYHYWLLHYQDGEDFLRKACINGDKELLGYIFKVYHKKTINPKKFLNKDHLIWCASFNGHHSVVPILLEQGVPVNSLSHQPEYIRMASEPSRATALELAVLHEHTEVVRVLLAHGANVHLQNSDGLCPLHYVPNAEMVKSLLEGGADLNAEADDGTYPIHTAAAAGKVSVIEKLIDFGAHLNDEDRLGRTAMHYACDVATATMISRYDPKTVSRFDKEGETPLLSAASKGHTDLVKFFCDLGVPIQPANKAGHTALHKACMFGHVATVLELLKTGRTDHCLQDLNGMTALDHAVAAGHEGVISVLLQGNPGLHGWQALHKAAIDGNEASVDLLLTMGVPVDAPDTDKRTALACCARSGRVEAAQRLIRNHAQIDQRCSGGDTPLMFAVEEGTIKMVELLLKAGANVDLSDVEGETALHWAVYWNKKAIIKVLMAHNAGPTISGRSGTPLQLIKLIGRHDLREIEALQDYESTWRQKRSRTGEESQRGPAFEMEESS